MEARGAGGHEMPKFLGIFSALGPFRFGWAFGDVRKIYSFDLFNN